MIPIIASDIDDVLITSDTHFDHGNIIKYCHRPFLNANDQAELARRGGRWHHGNWKDNTRWKMSQESIDLMNDNLINEVNAITTSKTILIHAGDFALWPKKTNKSEISYKQRCRNFRDRLIPERVYIVWGNHDRSDLIGDLFQWSGLKAKVTFRDKNGNDRNLIIDHYCEAVWDLSHRSAIHVYGHSHQDIEDGMNQLMPGRRSMDCGVDNAAKLLGKFRPFKLKEIIEYLAYRQGFSINPHIPTDGKSLES